MCVCECGSGMWPKAQSKPGTLTRYNVGLANWPKRQKCQIYERLKFKTATREGYRESEDEEGLAGRARQTLLD